MKLTSSSFMYHRRVAAGLDLEEVQLTETVSPTLYFVKPPVILGPSVGRTKNRCNTSKYFLSISFKKRH